MLPQWIIEKKRDGKALTEQELAFFIHGYTRGDIPDYQAAAFAMAVYFKGMTPAETSALTKVMMNSGETIDTRSIIGPKVDKHSTGGIGDKISIPLAPLVASCGVKVPMISGRGLGITGGTLDKLESIPGFNVQLQPPAFLAVLQSCGCAMIGQTPQIVPADRKLYALRDVTATVPSIPLIVSSIMSKKLAEGIDGLVLDIKCGSGAFMQTPGKAKELANALLSVGRAMGKRVRALITAMDEPLGRTVGNALEVAESIAILRDEGPADSTDLTLELAAEMLVLAGISPSTEVAFPLLRQKLKSGDALKVFRKMIAAQGGDPSVVENPALLPSAPCRKILHSGSAGYITSVNAETVGRVALLLGAGRTKTTDTVDHAAGISDLAKSGERVMMGQPLAALHASTPDRINEALPLLKDAFIIKPAPVTARPLILDRI